MLPTHVAGPEDTVNISHQTSSNTHLTYTQHSNSTLQYIYCFPGEIIKFSILNDFDCDTTFVIYIIIPALVKARKHYPYYSHCHHEHQDHLPQVAGLSPIFVFLFTDTRSKSWPRDDCMFQLGRILAILHGRFPHPLWNQDTKYVKKQNAGAWNYNCRYYDNRMMGRRDIPSPISLFLDLQILVALCYKDPCISF